MELEALLLHFFGEQGPESLTETEFDRAIEAMKIAFGVEREPGRKFALWTLLHTFDAAPLPADAFPKDAALKAAADEYLAAAFRLERFGPGDA